MMPMTRSVLTTLIFRYLLVLRFDFVSSQSDDSSKDYADAGHVGLASACSVSLMEFTPACHVLATMDGRTTFDALHS